MENTSLKKKKKKKEKKKKQFKCNSTYDTKNE